MKCQYQEVTSTTIRRRSPAWERTAVAAAYWARIPRIVFAASREDAAAAGFEDGAIYLEMPRAWAERRAAGVQLLRSEGRAVLEAWRANPHRVDY